MNCGNASTASMPSTLTLQQAARIRDAKLTLMRARMDLRRAGHRIECGATHPTVEPSATGLARPPLRPSTQPSSSCSCQHAPTQSGGTTPSPLRVSSTFEDGFDSKEPQRPHPFPPHYFTGAAECLSPEGIRAPPSSPTGESKPTPTWTYPSQPRLTALTCIASASGVSAEDGIPSLELPCSIIRRSPPIETLQQLGKPWSHG